MSHPRYEVFDPIAHGSFTAVYLGYDGEVKRDVAIKELKSEYRTDPRRVEHFWDEAKFLAGVNHAHIVQIYGRDEERCWIVMELMKGSLDGLIARKPMTPDLVRSVLRQVLAGLQLLHEQNKVHGAVRPSKLLIDDRGGVKLGGSAGLNVQEVAPPEEGMEKYLAPELVDPRHGKLGLGVDLYCLGFSVLELLKGPGFHALFKGVEADPKTGWLRVHGSQSERIPPAQEIASGVPADLARVIDKLLARDVRERYASASDAMKDLEERELLAVDLPAGAITATKPAPPKVPTPVTPIAGAPPVPLSPPLPPKPPAPVRPHVARPAAGPPPWSKDWLNQKLSNPKMLYPLLGFLILGTVAFFFWPEADDELQTMTIRSQPKGATVWIDGERRKNKTDYGFKVLPGKHKLKLELEGYQGLDDEAFEIKATSKPQEMTRELKPVVASGETPSPKVPETYVSNSIGMKLRLIPAGKFRMGALETQEGTYASEQPQHEVEITQAFYIGVHEVTQEEYQKVMNKNPSFFTGENGGGPKYPVDSVSWLNAVAFCEKLSQLPDEKKAGRTYRLPTEAEWEYACLGGTTTPFHFGSSLSGQANFNGSEPDGRANDKTMPVGSFKANAFGLYDMHGNVSEWCSDWFDDQYYRTNPGQNPKGPMNGEERVMRGGSWQSSARDCRSARRQKFEPNLHNVGFGCRVVLILGSNP